MLNVRAVARYLLLCKSCNENSLQNNHLAASFLEAAVSNLFDMHATRLLLQPCHIVTMLASQGKGHSVTHCAYDTAMQCNGSAGMPCSALQDCAVQLVVSSLP